MRRWWLWVGIILVLSMFVAWVQEPQPPAIDGSNAPGGGSSLSSEASHSWFRMTLMPFRNSLTGSAPPPTDESDFEWQVRVATRLPTSSKWPNYLALATYVLDGQEYIVADVLTLKRGGTDPLIGDWVIAGPKTKPDVPVFATLRPSQHADVLLLVGWVVDPGVDSFTLEFNDGSSSALSARTHPYFVGLKRIHSQRLEITGITVKRR